MKEHLPEGEELPVKSPVIRTDAKMDVVKLYDMPVTEEIVEWVKDVTEEIESTLPTNVFDSVDVKTARLARLQQWGTHWRKNPGFYLDDEPSILVKEYRFEDLAAITVRCEVNLDSRTFEFSYRWE